MNAPTSVQERIAQALGADTLTVPQIARRAGMVDMAVQSALRAMELRRDVVRVVQGKGLPFKFRVARPTA